MSSFISKDGVWHPAKERVGLKNYGVTFKDPKSGEMIEPGMDYIYEGPCRRALFDLWEAHGKPTPEQMKDNKEVMTLGVDFRKSPEFLQMLRDLNFKSAEEYLAWVGYNKEDAEKQFAQKASVVTKHDAPRRVAEIKRMGGGDNRANPGKDTRYGGFGDPKELSVANA